MICLTKCIKISHFTEADTDLRNTCRVKFYLNAHYNQTLTKYIKISHFAEADTGLGNTHRVKLYLSAYCNQTQK